MQFSIPGRQLLTVSGREFHPTRYDGREQALIKHELLKSYLEKLFFIVGMGANRGNGKIELCYIDAFAGPSYVANGWV